MQVKFKNDERLFNSTEPVEQKLFRAGEPVGWTVSFGIYGEMSSADVDLLLTAENISQLTFTGTNQEVIVIIGYENVSACTVRHRETETFTEIQLSRTITGGANGNG